MLHVTSLTTSDLRVVELKQQTLHRALTASQKARIAAKYGERAVTKYWSNEAALDACATWGIQPPLTASGEKRVRANGGLAFGPVTNPTPAPQESKPVASSQYSKPPVTVGGGGKAPIPAEPTPAPVVAPPPAPVASGDVEAERERKRQALSALVESTVDTALQRDAQVLLETVARASKAGIEAALETKLAEAVSTVQQEGQALVQEALAKIEEARPVVHVVRHQSEDKPDEDMPVQGMTHAAFPFVLKVLAAKQNVMLVGPAGCGKTVMAKQLADALVRGRFGAVNCTMDMLTSIYRGRVQPVTDAAGNTRWEYVPAPFVDMFENGGLFLNDEMDRGNENTLLTLNTALDNGYFGLPERWTSPMATKHADFYFVGSANTYGTGANHLYVGANTLDAATMDRFVVVEMDFDRKLERSVVDRYRSQVEGGKLDSMLARAWEVRDRINKHRVRRNIGTRFIDRACKLLGVGLSEDQIFTTLTAGWSADDLQKTGQTRVALF